jgi:hypothetical protein
MGSPQFRVSKLARGAAKGDTAIFTDYGKPVAGGPPATDTAMLKVTNRGDIVIDPFLGSVRSSSPGLGCGVGQGGLCQTNLGPPPV